MASELSRIAIKIDDQRVFALGVARPERDRGLLIELAAHLQADVELNAFAVCSKDFTAGMKGGFLGFVYFFVVIVFHTPALQWGLTITLSGDFL